MAKGVSGKTVRTDRARETFLAQLRLVPNVSAAARAAGMSRSAAYVWRDDDAAFAAEWDEAVQESVDALEQVAWERAQTTSDRLIEILLKGHRPERYVERSEVKHSGGMKLDTKLDLSGLSDAALRELANLAPDA